MAKYRLEQKMIRLLIFNISVLRFLYCYRANTIFHLNTSSALRRRLYYVCCPILLQISPKLPVIYPRNFKNPPEIFHFSPRLLNLSPGFFKKYPINLIISPILAVRHPRKLCFYYSRRVHYSCTAPAFHNSELFTFM